MNALLLIAAAILVPQEKNEAEELFKKMEEKIAAAKTLRLKMTGEMKEPPLALAAECWLGEGGRIRIDIEAKRGVNAQASVLVCDGERLRTGDVGRPLKDYKVSATVANSARLLFARCVVMGTMDSMNSQYDLKLLEKGPMAASGFKLGAKEKIGDRPVQILEYRLSPKEEEASEASVVAWIDTETNLPLKRTFKMGSATLEERYADFKLDEKIDPAKFELPKSEK